MFLYLRENNTRNYHDRSRYAGLRACSIKHLRRQITILRENFICYYFLVLKIIESWNDSTHRECALLKESLLLSSLADTLIVKSWNDVSSAEEPVSLSCFCFRAG